MADVNAFNIILEKSRQVKNFRWRDHDPVAVWVPWNQEDEEALFSEVLGHAASFQDLGGLEPLNLNDTYNTSFVGANGRPSASRSSSPARAGGMTSRSSSILESPALNAVLQMGDFRSPSPMFSLDEYNAAHQHRHYHPRMDHEDESERGNDQVDDDDDTGSVASSAFSAANTSMVGGGIGYPTNTSMSSSFSGAIAVSNNNSISRPSSLLGAVLTNTALNRPESPLIGYQYSQSPTPASGFIIGNSTTSSTVGGINVATSSSSGSSSMPSSKSRNPLSISTTGGSMGPVGSPTMHNHPHPQHSKILSPATSSPPGSPFLARDRSRTGQQLATMASGTGASGGGVSLNRSMSDGDLSEYIKGFSELSNKIRVAKSTCDVELQRILAELNEGYERSISQVAEMMNAAATAGTNSEINGIGGGIGMRRSLPSGGPPMMMRTSSTNLAMSPSPLARNSMLFGAGGEGPASTPGTPSSVRGRAGALGTGGGGIDVDIFSDSSSSSSVSTATTTNNNINKPQSPATVPSSMISSPVLNRQSSVGLIPQTFPNMGHLNPQGSTPISGTLSSANLTANSSLTSNVNSPPVIGSPHLIRSPRLAPSSTRLLQHSLTSLSLLSTTEDARPTPFQAAMTDLITISHQILDMDFDELLTKTETCRKLMLKLQTLQELWIREPNWPCKEILVRLLMTFSTVARLVEHLEADAGMWGYMIHGTLGVKSKGSMGAGATGGAGGIGGVSTTPGPPASDPNRFSGIGGTDLPTKRRDSEASGLGIDFNEAVKVVGEDDDGSASWTESGTEAGDSTTATVMSGDAGSQRGSIYASGSGRSQSSSVSAVGGGPTGMKKLRRTKKKLRGVWNSSSSDQVQVFFQPGTRNESGSVDNGSSPQHQDNLQNQYASHGSAGGDLYSGPLIYNNKDQRAQRLGVGMRLSNGGHLHSDLRAATDETQSVNILMEMTLDGFVCYVSPTVRTVFGYEPEECLTFENEDGDMDQSKLFLPPGGTDSAVFRDAIVALLADEQVTIEVTFRAHTKDGRWLEMEGKVRYYMRSLILFNQSKRLTPCGFSIISGHADVRSRNW
jgi:hypothetical protein